MAKKATKKTAKKTTKKASKKVAKKVTKKVAKKTTKKATKKVAKKVVKKVAAKPAKKVATQLPVIGTQAADFNLVNQDGKSIKLSDYRGKFVVVYFYPRAMTPGCTVQACGLRDKKSDLASHNIVVLGISPDKPAALKKFQEKDGLNFDLLSDEDHKVAAAYGSWGQKQFMGKTFDGILRQSFLLDTEGKIVHIISKVDTKTHAEDVLGFYSKLA